jgi:hypothetical protein
LPSRSINMDEVEPHKRPRNTRPTTGFDQQFQVSVGASKRLLHRSKGLSRGAIGRICTVFLRPIGRVNGQHPRVAHIGELPCNGSPEPHNNISF